jgi:hypothetical protein
MSKNIQNPGKRNEKTIERNMSPEKARTLSKSQQGSWAVYPSLLSSFRQITPGIALAPGICDGLDEPRGDAILLTQQFAVLGCVRRVPVDRVG